ncbi:unnamed protein product [Mytilus coruscus]|uniref:Uncharacterized protein n=1 Tax=Mytilus coruscus TaxID=42192 RepID=A0A6J8AYZ9_MYTCO|nr:unnamed protein product [Mytilus coruscus]
MREDLLDTQIKSNIENLVFYNIPEKDDEDCIEESLVFCEQNLKMPNMRDSIQILKANRMGNKGERIRPILVKFGSFKQREEVRKNGKNLKDTNFGISEQLPGEIQKRRKTLLPELKKLRDEGHKAYFVRDKIHVEYCNKVSVFVCGDFNSRTRLINDILPSDNLDRYIDVMWHDEVPNIPTRCSLDTIANRFGKLLIQLCYNTGLTICNGRLGNDRDGKFTFCSPNGRSLIDYMLASPNDYDKISNFGILNINEFSDHSPLVFEVGIKTVTKENLPKVSSFIKWEKDKVEEYKTKLNLYKNVRTEIVENLQQVGDAISAVKSLTDIIYNCAFEVFGSSRLTHEKGI